MIDLLAIKEKQKIVRGFYFRAVIVTFVMLGVVLLIATVALLPSYFFSYTQKSGASANLAKQESLETPKVDENTEKIVTDINDKIALIEKAQKEKFFVSQKVINEIILKKMPDIKIDKIFYQNDVTKGRTVSINGIAPNRERLLLFKQALENDPNFKDVNLPISNFIKGNNIKFSISLVSI